MRELAEVGVQPSLGRRHAAVLFADLSGFTALVESASPEIVYALVRPLMDQLVQLVRAHGGEVQQVLGDGFMAVFGLQPDTGDETVNAVLAAVELVRAAEDHGGFLPVHVGIEHGEVLVSPSWESASFAVWGRAVNVAKRLCDLAGPSTIHIGPGAFASGAENVLACLGVASVAVPTRLKGIAGDVVVHTVTGAAIERDLLAGCVSCH
jgi:class 3 adenylate cyclase